VNHAREQVDGRKDDLDLGVPDLPFPGAGSIEQVLDVMGQLLDAGDSERSSIAFEGMERPKHLVERLPIARHGLECEDAGLDGAEVIEGFGKEDRRQLGIAPKRRQFGIRRAGVRNAGRHQNCPKVPVSADSAASAAEPR
jgi:hypothetical protein